MRNARAHKIQWSGPTVHSSTVFGSCVNIRIVTILAHGRLVIMQAGLTLVSTFDTNVETTGINT